MRVGAAVMKSGSGMTAVEEQAQRWLQMCTQKKVELVVFPALFGLTMPGDEFVHTAVNWSREYPDIAICPGSWWEEEDRKLFHTTCLLHGGEVLLRQRQIYLAKWERTSGLARGVHTAIAEWQGLRIGLLLSTDIFYPQVARQLALKGANLILAPVALLNGGACAAQLAGMWQIVQQNGFFAIECGFKGWLYDRTFSSESIIHAPLDITEQGDGILARETDEAIVTADLDLTLLKKVGAAFNPLDQLNHVFYDKHLFR